jgi:chromosomal replication initiator protein
MSFTMREIATRIADKHGVSISDLKCESRVRKIAWARQEAYAEIQALTTFSTPQIGNWFGGRDHSTVIFGIRRHKEREAAAKAFKPRAA